MADPTPTRATLRRARSLALSAAFLGVLTFGNLLAARHNVIWDVTEGRAFTLSDQSEQILRSLQAEVKVTAFFAAGSDGRERLQSLLDIYAGRTPHLKVTFVDPDRDPAAARRYGVRDHGTTVFAAADRVYRITETSEEAVTNALVRVTRAEKKTVCFLSGHGEHEVDDSQRGGYGAARAALEGQGFAIRDVLLLRDAEVPEGCAVLVVAGPGKPFLPAELEALRRHLDRGGRLLALLEPEMPSGIEELLDEWGLRARDDMIVDVKSRLLGGSYTTPIITDYPEREVTRGFELAAFLPLARSLAPVPEPPPGISYRPVARTHPQAWGETDFTNERASFDPTRDFKGPLTVAALAERAPRGDGQPPAQLLAVGDSDFAANAYFHFSGNGDLFLNLISYLVREEDLVSVRPRDTRPRPLVLTRTQGVTLFCGSVVAAPLALALGGLSIWWRRRNL